MKTTRRGMMAGGLAGVLAVPTMAGLANWRWAQGEGSVLLHDPALSAGRRFAAAGRAAGGQIVPLAGDTIRTAQRVIAARPAMIAGISRPADAMLMEEAAAEAGYIRVAVLDGRGHSCTMADCRSGWQALGRMAQGAGSGWIEALAAYAAKPGEPAALAALPQAALKQAAMAPAAARPDSALVLGWVLAQRG